MGFHSSKVPLLYYLLFLISIIAPRHHAIALEFNYSFSDPNFNRSNMRFEANASYKGNIVNLNELDYFSAGRMTYKDPVPLVDSKTGGLVDFTTSFSFIMLNSSFPGDGLAFFISPFPSQIPSQVTGGCLGIFGFCGSNASTLTQVVAVEFDTVLNEWDPSMYHIGIDVRTVNSTAYQNVSGDMTGFQIDAKIDYISKTKKFIVSVSSYDSLTFGNYHLNSFIDLPVVLSNEVAIGFSAATGVYVQLHQIINWSFNSTVKPSSKRSAINIKLFAGLGVGIFIIVCFAGVFCFVWWGKRTKREESEFEEVEQQNNENTSTANEFDEGKGPKKIPYQQLVQNNENTSTANEFDEGKGPKKIPYQQLVLATRNFASDEKLGQGAFGSVYKGFLPSSGILVAIKRLSKDSSQGKKEYMAEVQTISQLRHKNLVPLVGWCHHDEELLIVYEYMPNGSLDMHLHSTRTIIRWSTRYKIVLGLGHALLYLHTELDQCIIHRDIKPSNVMLDSNFNPKLGDFGLARLIEHQGILTTLPAGTMGYIAPECVTTGKTSTESDVYSLGVTLLEIACGRRPVDPQKGSLLELLRDLYSKNAIVQAADNMLGNNFNFDEMKCVLVVGLWCAHPFAKSRPSIKQAMNVLQLEAPLPLLDDYVFSHAHDDISSEGSSWNRSYSAEVSSSSASAKVHQQGNRLG